MIVQVVRTQQALTEQGLEEGKQVLQMVPAGVQQHVVQEMVEVEIQEMAVAKKVEVGFLGVVPQKALQQEAEEAPR